MRRAIFWFIVAAAVAYLAAHAAALALATPPGWQLGHLALDVSASWWTGPGQDEPPVVAVDRGQAGAWCAPAGGACTVYAQGPWSRVVVDGELLHERGRAALPLLGVP